MVGHDVSRAADILRAGGLVAFPTETVYGLGAHALDTRAVARIFVAKNRPHFDPLIVHGPSREALERLASAFPVKAEVLADSLWPGPLSLVVPKTPEVPDLVTAGLPTVALRVPDHPLARQLLEAAALPVAAPSANPFGRLSPTTAEAVVEMLGDAVDYVLDGGPCRVGVESTVVQILADDEPPVLLRPGGVSLEEIEALIGPVQVAAPTAHPSAQAQPAPGMLPRHYAPRTPLTLVDTLAEIGEPTAGVGLLAFGPMQVTGTFAQVENVSPRGDLTEAAAEFFAALRRLDAASLERIYAVRFPEEGLGRALNDRLRRGAEG